MFCPPFYFLKFRLRLSDPSCTEAFCSVVCHVCFSRLLSVNPDAVWSVDNPSRQAFEQMIQTTHLCQGGNKILWIWLSCESSQALLNATIVSCLARGATRACLYLLLFIYTLLSGTGRPKQHLDSMCFKKRYFCGIGKKNVM